jgi:hypothetical protein
VELSGSVAAALRFTARVLGDVKARRKEGLSFEGGLEGVVEFGEFSGELLAKFGELVTRHSWDYITLKSQDQVKKTPLG